MKRAPPQPRARMAEPELQPSAENAALALREAAVLMSPVVRWLLRSGVSYPAFADMLKPVFLEAARNELQRSQAHATQSALSVLSGLHRKDVRSLDALAASASAPAPSSRPSLPSQVFTRWLTDSRYRGANGKPRALARTGTGRTFEALCRELSSDVHPRTVLDELARLGLVAVEGERVVAQASAFVPAAQLGDMTTLFSRNVADHIAAGVSNITTQAPRSLEQSIFADGLTPESIALLHQSARDAWAQSFDAVVKDAQARVDHDADTGGAMRMRFGVYFYSEPVASEVTPPETTPPATPQPRPARKPRTSRARTQP